MNKENELVPLVNHLFDILKHMGNHTNDCDKCYAAQSIRHQIKEVHKALINSQTNLSIVPKEKK